MMKEKQSALFGEIIDLRMCFSCKYLVDSRFNFFDELIDEIKKIKVFSISFLKAMMSEIASDFVKNNACCWSKMCRKFGAISLIAETYCLKERIEFIPTA
jgi:hypothetical protein